MICITKENQSFFYLKNIPNPLYIYHSLGGHPKVKTSHVHIQIILPHLSLSANPLHAVQIQKDPTMGPCQHELDNDIEPSTFPILCAWGHGAPSSKSTFFFLSPSAHGPSPTFYWAKDYVLLGTYVIIWCWLASIGVWTTWPKKVIFCFWSIIRCWLLLLYILFLINHKKKLNLY